MIAAKRRKLLKMKDLNVPTIYGSPSLGRLKRNDKPAPIENEIKNIPIIGMLPNPLSPQARSPEKKKVALPENKKSYFQDEKATNQKLQAMLDLLKKAPIETPKEDISTIDREKASEKLINHITKRVLANLNNYLNNSDQRDRAPRQIKIQIDI